MTRGADNAFRTCIRVPHGHFHWPWVLQFAEAVAIFAALPQNGRGEQLQIEGGGFALPANEVDAAAAGFDVYLPMWPQDFPHGFAKARQPRLSR